MSPVEQTTTSPAETPSASATCSAVRWVSWKPWCAGAGVGAAGVEDDRVDASVGDDLARPVTGAASTRLLVKTAAAWWSGPSLTTRARSGVPLALRPAVTPAARKPRAADGRVALTGRLLRSGRPRVSARPRARLAHWTAAPAVPLVRLSMAATTTTRPSRSSTRHLQLDVVAADDVEAVRGPLALGQEVDEGLVGVGRLPGLAHAAGARAGAQPGRAGGEDAARHRREGRGERHA